MRSTIYLSSWLAHRIRATLPQFQRKSPARTISFSSFGSEHGFTARANGKQGQAGESEIQAAAVDSFTRSLATVALALRKRCDVEKTLQRGVSLDRAAERVSQALQVSRNAAREISPEESLEKFRELGEEAS